MENDQMIRDLIYFDFDKAASIFSQVEGGLIKEIQSGSENSINQKKDHKFDLKLYKSEFGKDSSGKTSRLETKVLHHDLLFKIEEIVLFYMKIILKSLNK